MGAQPVEKGRRKMTFFSYKEKKYGIMVWGDKKDGEERREPQQMGFVSLEEMVPAESSSSEDRPAVDFNKLYEFVEKLYCEDNSRPGIDPVVLFKIVRYTENYTV